MLQNLLSSIIHLDCFIQLYNLLDPVLEPDHMQDPVLGQDPDPNLDPDQDQDPDQEK